MSRAGPKPSRPLRPSLVPPLQPGDHLTRAEFERRYDATPNLKKAELIEGIVYMPPPVSHREHAAPHALLVALVGSYHAATPNTLFGDNGSCRLDLDNMPQPDVYLLIAPECGGQASVDEDDYVAGAPEFIGEVAASSVSYDLHVKLNAYRRNGVREYLVWRTRDQEFDLFVLLDGEFRAAVPDEQGILRSAVFPGLWIATPALLRGDLAVANDVLRQGISTPEHAAFVQRLGRSLQ